ncbi:hypothetical protein ABEF92_005787 [Exophiala dermatitidis]|uniref:Chromo domain-containing protein n=1 Tax=Exophiala dermatitidis (strain ATCC 34100 / CBS 525.76 / NIH/UT8656) TaxID=858893 RepID=H6C3J0_EXODN|nr:uncharacterized protein HMPREF1120_06217 [Exophiala dermatitidis NIH/UT8656]EHY58205.1 hypothetical protein HMPREF1120_06217 [Exophiala dermatitidis NIH/UT8656]KAJ4513900.1 hypothetical protein HRR75_004481 [Exophiala dermatitidis]KAJ4541515.1 hypothetical protein HRR78_007399 [Exophiala dermatitidis]
MPRTTGDEVLADDLDGSEGSDVGEEIEETRVETDVEAKNQINGELQDEVEEEEAAAAAEEEAEAEAAPAADAPEDDEDVDEDDDEEGEDEYVVEAIRSHRVRNGRVEYLIKWLGYEESENTYEPEENLLPHAAKILASYHTALGGPPTAKNVRKSKSKQSLRRRSTASESPARASKRQKRSNGEGADPQQPEGDWLPSQKDWEPLIDVVDTVEKNEAGQLVAYIKFKNGNKTKVTMDKVYQHCPKAMLKFYEDHLKFK